jgi:glycosyltransferase involved in cell wall biosynthesis
VREAVASTLSDIGTEDAELVLIDDGSTDLSAKWLASLAATDSRVTHVRTSGLGLPGALNTGLAQTSSLYVARMDADDIWLPGRLAKQLRSLDETPDLAVAGCQIIRMVGHTEVSHSALPEEHDQIVDALQRGHHAICHPSVMMRRAHVESIGGYWSQGVAEDFDLFLRISELGRLTNLSHIGLKYRMHAGGINASQQLEVQRRMAYSAATYQQPRSELPYSEYLATLQHRPLRSANLHRKALALSLYRSGLVNRYAAHRRLYGTLLLSFSGALLPERAWQRLFLRIDT